jgi:hypothetical protein
MKKNLALQSAVIVIVAMLAIATVSMAFLEEFETDAPIEGLEMPKGMLAIVNEYDRVYGYVQDNYAWFYFDGNMPRLNAFLSQVGECSVCDLEVVLSTMPGTAIKATTFVDEPSGTQNTFKHDFKYDWQMSIEKLPRIEDQPDAWAVQVVVPMTSHEMLAAIQIPLAFRAAFGSQIAQLVQFHESRRRKGGEIERSTAPARLRRPTTLEMMMRKQRGFFGPETYPASSSPATQASGE